MISHTIIDRRTGHRRSIGPGGFCVLTTPRLEGGGFVAVAYGPAGPATACEGVTAEVAYARAAAVNDAARAVSGKVEPAA